MPPCPTSEQFLPPAHAYDVRSCKGNPPSRLAALACYTVTGSMCVDRHAPRRGENSIGRLRVNYRYYNPTDGKWTRRDPIGIHAGANLYVFVNNRLDSIDYLGNESCCAITLKLYLPEPLEIDKGDTLILRTGNSPGHTWLEFTNSDNKKQVFSFGPATTITKSNYDRFLAGKMTSIPNYPIKKSASASRSWELNHEQCEAVEIAIRNKGYYPNKGNYTPTYQCTSAALDVLNAIPNLDNVPSGSGPVKFKKGYFTIWEDIVANPYHLSNELQKQPFSLLT